MKPEDFPETIIPIQKSNAKLLFIVGEDDLDLESEMYANFAARILDKAGKSDNYQVIR